MITNSSLKEKKKPIKKKNLILIILIIIVIAFIFLQDYIENISNKIADFISPSYYVSIIKKFKVIFKTYFYEAKIQFLFAFIIIYNYGNEYHSFIAIQSYIISLFILIIIFFITNKILISEFSIFATIFNLCLYKMLFNKARKDVSCFIKFLGILFITSIISLQLLILYYYDIEKLQKIFYGIFFGIIIYILIFYVFLIELNDAKQLIKIIEFPVYYYSLIFLGINLLFIIFLLTKQRKNKNDKVYMKNLLYIIKCYSKLLMNIGIIFGMKKEYYAIFNKSYNNWKNYNFYYNIEATEIEDSTAPLYSFISPNKKFLWNYTSYLYTFLRIILSTILIYLTFSLAFLTYFYKKQNNILLSILCNIFSYNIFTYGVFYFYKQLLKYFKVTNILVFNEYRSSF